MTNRRKFFTALASLPAALIPLPHKQITQEMTVQIKLKPIEPEAMTECFIEAIRRNSRGITEEIIRKIDLKNGGTASR